MAVAMGDQDQHENVNGDEDGPHILDMPELETPSPAMNSLPALVAEVALAELEDIGPIGTTTGS